jgi:hypothetical protein
MAEFVVSDVVIVPFPFSDLSELLDYSYFRFRRSDRSPPEWPRLGWFVLAAAMSQRIWIFLGCGVW